MNFEFLKSSEKLRNNFDFFAENSSLGNKGNAKRKEEEEVNYSLLSFKSYFSILDILHYKILVGMYKYTIL